jgi:23S rRNA (uracil-5-)-methyltransferase RumA
MKLKEFTAKVRPSCNSACIHFPTCGGCQLLDRSYEDELAAKKEYLKQLFKQDVPLIPAVTSEGYRNRMDFVYTQKGLCLREEGKFNGFVPITNCLHLPDFVQTIFDQINNLLQENNIVAYNHDTQEGFLKYVIFRYSRATKQVMVIFTTSTAIHPLFEDLIQKVSATSTYWFVNESITDISMPEKEPHKQIGQTYIADKFNELTFHYGPHSFFQANSSMVTKIFDEIKKFTYGETMDVCCGVGTIALYVADKASSMVGLECVPEAIDLAKLNAKNNDVSAKFFVADMKKLLEYAPQHVDTLIVDPPRKGLEKKTVERIQILAPDQIIYMSCNPKTQKIDFKLFTDYDCEFLQAYDVFPRTNHLETLAVLKRKSFEN